MGKPYKCRYCSIEDESNFYKGYKSVCKTCKRDNLRSYWESIGQSGIYTIANPIGEVYVGSTKNLERRLQEYGYMNTKNKKLLTSYKTYGLDNHIFKVEEYCSVDRLHEREYAIQLRYDSVVNGLNVHYTNPKTVPKRTKTKDAIDRISKGLTGKSDPIETVSRKVESAIQRGSVTYREKEPVLKESSVVLNKTGLIRLRS